MTSSRAYVTLFDIDGTLVTGPDPNSSPGMDAMARSAHCATGRKGLRNRVEFAGRTDPQIARDLLRAGGQEKVTSDDVARLIDGYIEWLTQGVESRPYRAIGTVREAVAAVNQAGAIVGLGTGNVVRGARVKLTSAGLIDLFDLSLGGFGDDGETRAELLRVGVERCDPSGTLPVVVIGDTPHDIRAAHLINAQCVAVTTGPYSADSLRELEPALLLDDLGPDLGVRIERMMKSL